MKTRKHPCAPALWKKFSPEQKILWMACYRAMRIKENLPIGVTMTHGQMKVLAHNMACHAAWASAGKYPIIQVEKKSKTRNLKAAQAAESNGAQ